MGTRESSRELPGGVGESSRVGSSTSQAVPIVALLSGDFLGLDGRVVDVQVNVVRQGDPKFTVVGLPGKSTRESRERICAALRNSGFRVPLARIVVNLAPASLEKEGAGFDLAVAIGILVASGQVAADSCPGGIQSRLARLGLLGELGLTGEVRAVRGALLTADALQRRGVEILVVPVENAAEVGLLRGAEVRGVSTLREAVAVVRGEHVPERVPGPAPSRRGPRVEDGIDFAQVRAQEATKRGLLVAAAGGHNVLLSGPPGVGKTMLARRLPGILPPLSAPEAMEVLRVASAVSGEEPTAGLCERPFRAPHHTISYAGLVGGGPRLRPGEVSRAHNGVLFLDEFPEFGRRPLEALREPLEEGRITVGRSIGAATFPARFLLVAAMNPCPCGYLGHPQRACSCTRRVLDTYLRRISGPLADRIDLVLRVSVPDPARLMGGSREPAAADSASLRSRVLRARERQSLRWGPGLTNSAVLLDRLLEQGGITRAATDELRRHAERLGLTTRGFTRALRVARTIADLEDGVEVEAEQVLEALQYRRGGAF